jgi:serine-type D-Ala-D-Ala carboxypeptidase (penicillin-binding protein 5/6)
VDVAVTAAVAMPARLRRRGVGPVPVIAMTVVIVMAGVLVVVVVVVVRVLLHGAILRVAAVRPSPLVAALGAVALAVAVTTATVRVTAAVPPVRADVHTDGTLTVPGDPAPPVDLPQGGSLVVEAAAGTGAPSRLASLAPTAVRPIGSVAKTMTALAVLQAHPLAVGEEGPELTMTSEDVTLFESALAVDGSSLPVHAGERLSERALLLGLMLPSANNLAETLARWVSGSHGAFVALLNADARRLGMTGTHFDDPSGFSSRTVSTAVDLVVLGRAALAVPALAAIVATAQAPFPDGTTLHNLDSMLGNVPGWLGIKTGETPTAGGCLLFAARRAVGDAPGQVTVVGAVLGQPHLAQALFAARDAVESAYAGYTATRLAGVDPPVTGSVVSPWGDTASVVLGAADGDTVAVRPGDHVDLVTVAVPLGDHLIAGDTVARLEARSGRAVLARWRVVISTGLGPAPFLWRLLERH